MPAASTGSLGALETQLSADALQNLLEWTNSDDDEDDEDEGGGEDGGEEVRRARAERAARGNAAAPAAAAPAPAPPAPSPPAAASAPAPAPAPATAVDAPRAPVVSLGAASRGGYVAAPVIASHSAREGSHATHLLRIPTVAGGMDMTIACSGWLWKRGATPTLFSASWKRACLRRLAVRSCTR